MDQHSPTAISIALDIHWHHSDVCHCDVEAMCRQGDRVGHIIGGHNLIVHIKNGCKRCCALNKKSIEGVMGRIRM